MQPEFICIGFQKCGTTTLYDLLRQHRGIVLTDDVKEPMIYRQPYFYKHLGGKEWYEQRYFSHVAEDDRRLRGEVNAGLGLKGCAERIGQDYPENTKLIFMMRSPADRAYSAYKYFLALGFLPAAAMEDDRRHGHEAAFDRYVRHVLANERLRGKVMEQRQRYLVFSQGNYATLIGEYLRYFPQENMKFIFFEEFIRDQHAACRDLYAFLGIEDDPVVEYGLKSNEGNFRARNPLWARIGVGDMGVYYFCYEFMNWSHTHPVGYGRYDRVHQKIQKHCVVTETDSGKMLPQTREILERYYRKEVRGVEHLTGRSLKELWY